MLRQLVITSCALVSLQCTAKMPVVGPKTPASETAAGVRNTEGTLCVKLAPLIEPLVDRAWMASVSVAWLEAGQHEICSFGTERAGRARATPDTLYEIGSLTKLFTGLLLGSMLSDGTVALEEPFAALLPPSVLEPAPEIRKITLLQLAMHRSGLPRMPNNVGRWNQENPYGSYDTRRLFTYLANAKLTAVPGTQYLYSNLGAALLGQALALRAGRPYEELVRARVLAPLGMNDTYFTIPSSTTARAATGHDADGAPRRMWDFNALSPAGALRSTARDMTRFADAALKRGPSPLSRAVELAEATRAEANAGRRIGLFFQRRRDGVYWHNGSTAGFSSYMAFEPELGNAIVVLTSTASILTDALGDKLWEFQRGAPLEPFVLPDDLTLSPSRLAEYQGAYALSEDVVVRVFIRDDALHAQASGQDAQRLWPTRQDQFYFRVARARLQFERQADHSISAMILDHEGARQRAVRRHD